MLDKLRNNPLIKEKDLGEGIHSFNFTRKAFYENEWNEQTITARGLFVDVNNEKVFARSYNKFFNLGERPETTTKALRKNLAFPVAVYKKENGYLGICTADKANKELWFASKSTNHGQFAAGFKEIFEKTVDEQAQKDLYNFCARYNYSAIFEVIDVEHDRHIVEYPFSHVVLLDMVRNSFDLDICYPLLYQYALGEHINYKQQVLWLNNWDEFMLWYNSILEEVGNEGYVLRDRNNFMFKIKTPWYTFWKNLRSAGVRIWARCDLDGVKWDRFDYDPQLAREVCDWYLIAAIEKSEFEVCPHIIDVRNAIF